MEMEKSAELKKIPILTMTYIVTGKHIEID